MWVCFLSLQTSANFRKVFVHSDEEPKWIRSRNLDRRIKAPSRETNGEDTVIRIMCSTPDRSAGLRSQIVRFEPA